MNNTLELKIVCELNELRDMYDEVQQLTKKLTGLGYGQAEFADLMGLITTKRAEIDRAHGRLRPIQEQYIAENEHASNEVKSLTDSVTRKIQDLMMQYSQLETQALSAKEKIKPAVNESLRAVQMKSAYKRHAT